MVLAILILCSMTLAEAQAPESARLAVYEVPLSVPRYAVLIGVENYREHDRIPNAINDAQVMGHALEATGTFTNIRVVTQEPDTDTSENILAAIDEILNRAGEGPATIVFYFAGHGFQFDGANYLVPRLAGKPVREPSTRLMNKQPLVQASLNIATITERLRARAAGANILFIDACRTDILGVNAIDPKAEPKGFLRLIDPQDALISFSTGFNDVAESQSRVSSRNSPYAAVMSDYLTHPAMTLNPDILANVQLLVRQATGHQAPEPLGPYAAGVFFYFKPTPNVLNTELDMWRKAMVARTKNCVGAFLHKYRDGYFSRQALVYLVENPIADSTNQEPPCDLLQ
jgi:hypothetical protein